MNKHRRPKSHRVRNTGVIVGVTGAAVVAGTGSASAYWTGRGAGDGAAAAGPGTTITITTAAANPDANLYPTGPKVGLKLTISPASQSFKVTGLSQDSTRPVLVSGALGTCDGSVISVDTITGLAIAVTTAAVSTTVPAVVDIADTAPNGCQGATFTIPIVLTGQTS